MLSRKYMAIARMIVSFGKIKRVNILFLAQLFIDYFKLDNPRFDANRFLDYINDLQDENKVIT